MKKLLFNLCCAIFSVSLIFIAIGTINDFILILPSNIEPFLTRDQSSTLGLISIISLISSMVLLFPISFISNR
jgi:hypothetical protein